MEKELNIAAILKEKPKGTKLWSPVFGECKLLYITDFAEPIQLTTKSNETYCFRKDGRYVREGEIMLFPSKRIPNWSKFAWKKGDVLQISDVGFCTFEAWTSDDYTTFKGRYGVNFGKNSVYGYYISKEDLNTFMWYKVDDDNLIKQYLDEVEKQIGGKLNLETLEIGHPKQEFKDGDIVISDDCQHYNKSIFIIKRIENDKIYYAPSIVFFDGEYDDVDFKEYKCFEDEILRLATDSEKQLLFSSLEKEGKRWNPDTKTIEDLPKKCEFKPFDKVLVRNNDAEIWIATLFGFYDKEFENYVCLGDVFDKCIPYNEETKHLLGTTDEWKGGEA